MGITELSKNVISLNKPLQAFALNLTRNMQDSEDLYQETMLRAMSNLEKFKSGTNLKAWLFTIMKNIFINNYRKNAKRNTILDSTDNQYYINSAGFAAPNQAEANFKMEQIKGALGDLNPEFRVPFLLYFTGHKYHEIAQYLKLPLGTVKSRIFFARKQLKKDLAELRKD